VSSSLRVVVVGAGPAGATAARALARAGVTVTLLDRSNFPRNKPCGGAISMRALARFPYLESALDRIPTHRLSRLHLEGPGGESAVIESDAPAVLMIRRVEFDAELVRLAVDAGAQLVSGADIVQAFVDGGGGDNGKDRVTLVSRDGRRFEAPVVIAADGVHSVVARRLGISPGWPATSVALDMMEEAPRAALRDLDPATLWVSYGFEAGQVGQAGQAGQAGRAGRVGQVGRVGRAGRVGKDQERRAAEGYAYVFPKRDHVNVGIGYVLRHFRDHVDRAPYDLHRCFVDDLRARGVLEGESTRRHFTPFLVPVGGPLRRPGRGRVLLAGDAGGFVNGFTAEGIYYAMVSGELAARTVLVDAEIGGDAMLERYSRACEREMGRELRESVLIQRLLFADRRKITQVVRGASSEEPLTRTILDFAIGRVRYATVRRQLLMRAPAFALQLSMRRWLDRLPRRSTRAS
jgi:flavin-dependent dehydrogenase